MASWTALTLLRNLESRHGLALPHVDRLAARLERVSLRQREAAFRQGTPCRHVYVVRTGLLKQVYLEADGSEWIKSFTGPGDLFACLQAVAHGRPATFSSIAIEPSEVERIDFSLINALADENLAWQRALRIAFQGLAELKVQRERDLLSLSARQLYRRLAASAPEWIGRVPQKDLAAYLGVTPVGLNRIIRRPAPAATQCAPTGRPRVLTST